MNRLMQLANQQKLIDDTRELDPNNQRLQTHMDRLQAMVIAKTNELYEEIFEIARNN
jgi:hypothetical protein